MAWSWLRNNLVILIFATSFYFAQSDESMNSVEAINRSVWYVKTSRPSDILSPSKELYNAAAHLNELRFNPSWIKTFSEKLQRVRNLISYKERSIPYEPFLAQAEQCRLYRNKLVHVHWEFIEWTEKSVQFHAPAPFEENGSVSLDDLSKEIRQIEETNLLFTELRQAYPLEF